MNKKLLFLSLALNLMFIIAFFFLVHSLGGWNYTLYKMKNRGAAGNYDHQKNLFEVLPKDSATIVFLGNSMTAYCEWAEIFQNPNIRNRGIAGDYSSGVLDRLPEIIAMQPKQIFLMIGINDLLFRTPPVILDYYAQIVDKIKRECPQTELLLQSVLPINNAVRNTRIQNATIQTLNQGIQKLAAEQQLKYVDLYPLLLDKNGNLDPKYTQDGIHINGEAYLIWKKAIEKYIK